MNEIIKNIEAAQLKAEVPAFNTGDTVRVHALIKEGNRERVQVFEGTVLKKQGGSNRATFTVRKSSNGVGVEKTWPLHSPHVVKVEVQVGERFFVNRAVYKVSSPERGDIIVYKTSGSDDAALHIGRVIGLPGETVQISNGAVLINGEVYNENKNFPEISNAGLASDGVSLESGEYFVLGDNRNNSEDSRYGDIGNINKKYIVGKVWFVISPKDKFGFLKG